MSSNRRLRWKRCVSLSGWWRSEYRPLCPRKLWRFLFPQLQGAFLFSPSQIYLCSHFISHNASVSLSTSKREKRKSSCSLLLLLKDSWCEAKIKLSYFKDGYLLREDDLQGRKHLLNATLLTADPSYPPLNCMTYIKFSPSFINCAARKNWTCETGCHTAANGHLGGKINH